jgi:BlaI family penicillinase repressor
LTCVDAQPRLELARVTMSSRRLPRPTDRELAILTVLWRRGPSTVRDVHTALSSRDGTGYTTTLKLMQIMHEKGLVARDESRRTHIYRAAQSAEQVESEMLGGLLDKLFSGSAERLVVRALSSRKVPREELARIRELLDAYERQRSSRKGGSS